MSPFVSFGATTLALVLFATFVIPPEIVAYRLISPSQKMSKLDQALDSFIHNRWECGYRCYKLVSGSCLCIPGENENSYFPTNSEDEPRVAQSGYQITAPPPLSDSTPSKEVIRSIKKRGKDQSRYHGSTYVWQPYGGVI